MLSEAALCEEFSVSRSPVREALRALAAGGLITKQGRSYVVKQISIQDVRELYEYRLALELFAVERTTKSPESHSELHELYQHWMNIHTPENQFRDLAIADREFHETLMSAFGNRTILGKLIDLNERLHVFRMMDFEQPNRLQSTREEHLAILDAVFAGDVETAKAKLRRNIEEALKNVETGFADLLAKSFEF